MPHHTPAPYRQRRAGSDRRRSEQVSHDAIDGHKAPSQQKTDTSPDEGRLHGQWEERRLTLVTPPAGLRYLTGRY
jgi:hypothetical protein